MARLNGKSVIITGGCGNAGKEICYLFAREKAHLTIIDKDEKKGILLAKQINEAGGKALFIKGDISKEENVIESIKACIKKYGTVDILVNAASILGMDQGCLVDISEEMFDREISINLKGTFLMVKNVLPIMIKKGQGNIVNFSSVGAMCGTLGHTVFNMTKAGIESLTRSIVSQYGKQGIRANCIRPGVMLNPVYLKNQDCQLYGEYIASHIPGKRVGMGSDIAPVALFLASNESYYINGQIITADGGLTMHEPQWKEELKNRKKVER